MVPSPFLAVNANYLFKYAHNLKLRQNLISQLEKIDGGNDLQYFGVDLFNSKLSVLYEFIILPLKSFNKV